MTVNVASLEALADLQGLIPHEVGVALAEMAGDVPADLAIVELGSYKGKSTCYLAAGALMGNGAHVFAVDPWDTPGNVTGRHGYADPTTYATFREQVERAVGFEAVTPLQGWATGVAATWHPHHHVAEFEHGLTASPREYLMLPVGLLYVDSDHEAPSVRQDFWAWRPHLAPGARVAFDDYGTPRNPGVAEVVDQLVDEGTLAWVGKLADRLAVGQVPPA